MGLFSSLGSAFGGPLGGTIGGFLDASETSRKSTHRTQLEQRHQDNREDSKYQRAVKDAKAAGLHPLFAMGAGGVPGPTTITGQSETGSVAKDIVYKGAKGNSQLTELQIKNAEVDLRRNLIDEQLMRSQLARETGALTNTPGDIRLPPATIDVKNQHKYDNKIEIIPSKITTSRKEDASQTPGEKPGWDRIKIFPDLPPIFAPVSEEGWAEDLTIAKFFLILAKNGIELIDIKKGLGAGTTVAAFNMFKKAAIRSTRKRLPTETKYPSAKTYRYKQ